MRILLDTHLLLWWLANDDALPDRGRALISDPENTVFVSAVSLWEIWLKVSLNKLRVPAYFEERLAWRIFREPASDGESDAKGRVVAVVAPGSIRPDVGRAGASGESDPLDG